jgi:hypothetical protein
VVVVAAVGAATAASPAAPIARWLASASAVRVRVWGVAGVEGGARWHRRGLQLWQSGDRPASTNIQRARGMP